MNEPLNEPAASEARSCRALRAGMAAARRSIAGGAIVDLSGFDRDVATLCAAIVRLPAAARRPLEAELIALLADLDELSQVLTAQNAELTAGETDAARLRAAQAYGSPGAPDQRTE